MSDGKVETSENSAASQPILLYRGIWAADIENGQLIPVGSSIFSDDLSINLRVDYDSFNGVLENYTEKITQHYEANKQQVEEWLKEAKCDVDPYLFFACTQAQLKMETLLQVNRDEHDEWARRKLYPKEGTPPNLSDLKGKAACAEQAALGKYLLKLMGIDSVYMSGVTMVNPEEAEAEDHTFLILNDPGKDDSLIFDIARPKSQYNLPRLLRTTFPLTAETFKDKRRDVVQGTDILDGKQLYYGVGHSMEANETAYNVIKAA